MLFKFHTCNRPLKGEGRGGVCLCSLRLPKFTQTSERFVHSESEILPFLLAFLPPFLVLRSLRFRRHWQSPPKCSLSHSLPLVSHWGCIFGRNIITVLPSECTANMRSSTSIEVGSKSTTKLEVVLCHAPSSMPKFERTKKQQSENRLRRRGGEWRPKSISGAEMR